MVFRRRKQSSAPAARPLREVGNRRALAEPLEARVLLVSQPYAWQNAAIGAGGFVDGIFFDPVNPNVIYARTDIGGVFKTTNGNAGNATLWKELLDWTDNTPNNDYQQMGVLGFAIDPQNPAKLYVQAGMYVGTNGWLMRSVDGGANFNQIRLPFYVGGNSNGRATGERLAVDPNKGSILFIGTNNAGLYSSTDSGASVSPIAAFPLPTADIDFVTFDPSSASPGNPTQTIYVGVNSTAAGSNVYKTINGGATWNLLAGAGAPSGLIPMRGVRASDGKLYFTFSNGLPPGGSVTTGAVYRLDPVSGAWTNISPLTPGGGNTNFGYNGLAVDPANPARVIVTSLNRYSGGLPIGPDQMWRTTNASAASPTWVYLYDASSSQNFGFGGHNTTRDTSNAPWVAGFGDGIGNWPATVAIDPFNPAHIMYGNGQGIWATDNGTSPTKLSAAGSWYFPDDGIEFTAVNTVVAPASGVPIYSAIGDIQGFAHTTLNSSPAGGNLLGGGGGSGRDIDFAQSNPSVAAWSGATTNSGAYTLNGGATWTRFAADPGGVGTIAVSADGATLVCVPAGGAPMYSTDSGTSWIAAALPASAPAGSTLTGGKIISDRVNPNYFYYYTTNSGNNNFILYVSSDAGLTFTLKSQTGTGSATLIANPFTAGDLWLGSYNPLYESTNFGTSFTYNVSNNNVDDAQQIALGKTAPGQAYPAIYIWGTIAGATGAFRSDNKGASWVQINDPAHQFGGLISTMAADPNVFGRMYMGFNGRGIIVGNPVNSLPAGWSDADINTPGNPGWASSSTALSTGVIVNQWTVNGGGAGITGSSDQFNFAFQNVTGDYAAIAQLKSLTNAGTGTPRAGVMFRGGVGASDPFAALLQTTANQLVFTSRTTVGGGITTTTLGGVPVGAQYVSIARSGNSFNAFHSADGSHWTRLGLAIAIPAMPAAANVGLAVTADYNAQLSSATFTNVAVGLTAGISGNVFIDNNGNGALNAGEAAPAAVTVFLDDNDNGLLDAGETSTSTSGGSYSFSGLPPGTFTVRQVVPGGFVQSGPNPGASPVGALTVTVAAGAISAGNHFGVFPISFAGGASSDNYYVRLNASATNLEIHLSTTALVTPTYTIARSLVPSLAFSLAGGGDSLTVDFANSNPAPAGGISFDGGALADSLTVLGASGNDLVQIGASTLTFGTAAITFANTESIAISTGDGNDTLTQTAQPLASVSFNGGAGIDTLNVNAGTFAFTTDAGATTSSLTVNVANAGSLVSFAGNQHLSAVNVSAGGAAVMTASVSAASSAIMTVDTLTVSGGGSRLDLTNNEMLGAYGLATARSQIIAAQLRTSLLSGVLGSLDLGGGIVRVRFTLRGDSNLDGTVDVADLGNLSSNYGRSSGAMWADGDFNYNGTVDVADLGDLAGNFGSSLQSAGLSTASALTTTTTRRTRVRPGQSRTARVI